MQPVQNLTYTLESKDIIDRAFKGKQITDAYDLKYLMEVINKQGSNKLNAFHDNQKLSFDGYSSNVMLFIEGKHFSKKSDIGSMAFKIA